jgi:hypothetical protein
MVAASRATAEAGGSDVVAPEAVAFPSEAAVPDDAAGARLGRASGATSSPRRKRAQAVAPPPTARRRTTRTRRAGRDLIWRSFWPAVRDF